jgi:hypothetical protein
LPGKRCGQHGGRQVGEVVCDDHVCAARACGSCYVPVTGIGELDGRQERFPSSARISELHSGR